MCAIHGKPFCTSARDAFNLLMRNVLRVVALDKVTDFLFFLSKVLVTVGMGAATYFYFVDAARRNLHELHYIWVPVAIVMIGTYLISSVFFGVYSMAVDTLFLCFRELKIIFKSSIYFYSDRILFFIFILLQWKTANETMARQRNHISCPSN